MARCLRWPYGSTVDVLHSPQLAGAAFSGLQTCGSVWLCPVCAAKISERRRIDLGEGVSSWQQTGGAVALVTYTLCHRWEDDLRAVLDGLLAVRKWSREGRWATDFKRRHGLAGSVRALEVTHGCNGWHPHLHELMFVRGDVDQVELLAQLRERWTEKVRLSGLREVNHHGVDVRIGDLTVADYVAKFGHERTWDVQHELAKSVSKQGRPGHRSPAGLLADYTLSQDDSAGVLWRHYGRVFKGQRQLWWSHGLRQLLGLGVEQTDAEIAADVRTYPVLLAQLTREQWRVVLGNDARAEVLQIASRGDAMALWLFLQTLGC